MATLAPNPVMEPGPAALHAANHDESPAAPDEEHEALAELASELVVNPTTLVDTDGVESLVRVPNNIDQGNLLRSLKIEVYFPARGAWR